MGGKLSKKNKSYNMATGGQDEVGGGSPVDENGSSPAGGEVTVTGLKKTPDAPAAENAQVSQLYCVSSLISDNRFVASLCGLYSGPLNSGCFHNNNLRFHYWFSSQ